MIKKVLVSLSFTVAAVVVFSLDAHAACQTGFTSGTCNVVNATGNPSCELSDVVAAVGAVHDGDTVAVPAGTCTWTNKPNNTSQAALTISKGITLQGAGCPLDVSNGWPIANSPCSTIIFDDVDSSVAAGGALITFSCVNGKSHTLTGFE